MASSTGIGPFACDSLPFPVIPGAKILSVVGAEVYNFSGIGVPDGSNTLTEFSDLNFCDVNVTYTHPGLNDSVQIELWLPLEGWSGRLEAVGGGGYAAGFFGPLMLAPAVAKGNAAGATNGGNLSTDSVYPVPQILQADGQIDLGLFADFSSRSLHELAVVGKAIATSFYGEAPHHSYWTGCSTGGRQGHILAQKYPTDFDGIIANAPAVYWPSIINGLQWPQVVMEQANYFPSQCEFSFFQNQSISACDALDGVVDNIIGDPSLCDFDPGTLIGQEITCYGEQVNISRAAAEIVQQIHDGAPGAFGTKLWYGYAWGSDYSVVANTTTVNGTTTGTPWAIPETWIATFLKQDPSFDVSSLTLLEYTQLFALAWAQYGGIIGSSDPVLDQFRNNGGKLLTWHGLADQSVPVGGTLHYRDQVERVMGGYDLTNEFYRLFLAPGVKHCGAGTGNGPVPTDVFAALVAWVEEGEAPDVLTAVSVNAAGANVTKDLCLYPLVSKYDGRGDVKLASSYSCQESY